MRLMLGDLDLVVSTGSLKQWGLGRGRLLHGGARVLSYQFLAFGFFGDGFQATG